MEFRHSPTIVSDDKTTMRTNLLLRPKNGLKVQIQYYDLIDGTEITVDNKFNIIKKNTQHMINEEYTTADHLPVVVTITLPNDEKIKCVYFSLGNLFKSNINDYSFKNSLKILFDVVNKLIKNIGGKCFAFFSESGRHFLDDEMNWDEIVKFICEYCDFQYLWLSRSNKTSDIPFGVLAFASKHFEKDKIDIISATYSSPVEFNLEKCSSLLECGPVIIGLDYEKIIIWGIYFPLDFKCIGPENQGAISMTNLCNLMKEYPRSVCAFGDFNTVPGNIENSIINAVDDEFELIWPEFPTFFGSYYDTIPSNPNDQVQLLD